MKIYKRVTIQAQGSLPSSRQFTHILQVSPVVFFPHQARREPFFWSPLSRSTNRGFFAIRFLHLI